MSTIEQKISQLLGQMQFQLVSNAQTIEEQTATIAKLENELESVLQSAAQTQVEQALKS